MSFVYCELRDNQWVAIDGSGVQISDPVNLSRDSFNGAKGIALANINGEFFLTRCQIEIK